MKVFKIMSLAAVVAWLPALAIAQLPGEPKPPGAFDGPADTARYRAQIGTPDDKVRDAQQALQDHGYYQGPLDGVMSPKTRRAVWKFQSDQGLQRTARLDPPTMAALGLAKAPVENPISSPSASPPPPGFEHSDPTLEAP